MAGILDYLGGGLMPYGSELRMPEWAKSLAGAASYTTPVGVLGKAITPGTYANDLVGLLGHQFVAPVQQSAPSMNNGGAGPADMADMYGSPKPQQAPAPMQMQPPQQAAQSFDMPGNAFQWGSQTFPMYGGPQMAQAEPAALPPNAQPTAGRGQQPIAIPNDPQSQPQFSSELFAAPKQNKFGSFLENTISALNPALGAQNDAKTAQREMARGIYGFLSKQQGMDPERAAEIAVIAARDPEVRKEILKPYANLDAASASQYQGRGNSNDALGRKVQQTAVLKAAEHAAVNGGVNLTPGQKALDDKFAPDAQEWLSGGYTDVQKNVQNLQGAVAALRSGRTLTGPITGATPDGVRSFTNPESIAIRDRVGEVVQRNLRTVLGAQFTQQEGNALIARAYNEKLSEPENARRIENLMNQIQGAAQAKQEMTDYFTKNGTLQGYTGKVPRIGDFDPESDRNPYAPKPKNVSSGDYVFDGKVLRKVGR